MKTAITYNVALDRLREVFRELYAPKTSDKEELEMLEKLVTKQISDFARNAEGIPAEFLSKEDLEKVWFKDLMADAFDIFLETASLHDELALRVFRLG